IQLGVGLFFRDVVNSSCRVLRQGGERYGAGNVIYIASHSTPSAKIFRENDRRTTVIHPLEHREETMELVTRPIDHWEAEHGSRQLRVRQHFAFNRNFVVVVIKPRESALQGLDHLWRIGLQLR